MTTTIETVEGARALLDQLAETIPPFPLRREDGTLLGWEEGNDQAYEDVQRAEEAATRFLLDAVDWNVTLLDQLAEVVDLSYDSTNVVWFAYTAADHASRDPRLDWDGDGSTGEMLAYWAVVGEPIRADQWRACDVAAALDVLPRVLVETEQDLRAGKLPYDHLRHEVDARLALLDLEPSMPDRRPQEVTQ
jgi:hypothetical protein